LSTHAIIGAIHRPVAPAGSHAHRNAPPGGWIILDVVPVRAEASSSGPSGSSRLPARPIGTRDNSRLPASLARKASLNTEHAVEIDVHQAAPVLLAQLQEGGAGGHARVVDQNGHRAQGRCSCLEGALDGGAIRDIEHDRCCLAAPFTDSRRQLLEAVEPAGPQALPSHRRSPARVRRANPTLFPHWRFFKVGSRTSETV